MTDPCINCKALCCQYFCFEIDEPDDFEEFDDVRWYLCHEGVSVHIDEDGDWFIQIENSCMMLDKNYRCTIYEDRPLICRNYTGQTCEATGDDYGYQEEFTTPGQIIEFARKTLGKETYEREMIKHRAKAEGVSSKQMRARLLGRGLVAGSAKKKGKKKK